MKHYIQLIVAICISLVADSRTVKHDLIIRNINIIDVQTGRIIPKQTVAIDRDKISKIYSKKVSISDSTLIIEGDNKYIIPGLFDSHMHISNLTNLSKVEMQNELMEFINNGVFYLRDVGGPVDVLKQLTDKITSGELFGPEIYYAGPMLETSPLYWEELNKDLPGFTVALNTIEDIDSLLPELASKGATMIKTFSNIKAELYPHIVEVAKANNLKIVHDPGVAFFNNVPMGMALALGATSIEHSQAAWGYILKDEYRSELDSLQKNNADIQQKLTFMFRLAQMGIESISDQRLKAFCDIMKEKHAVYCPTIKVSKGTLSDFEKEISEGNNDERLLKNKILQSGVVTVGDYIVRKFSENGVKVIVRQDNADPEGTFKEMVYLSNVGVNNIDVLRGATLYPAEWLGLTKKYGSVRPAKAADLVILNSNPIENIQNIKDIFKVIKQGKVIKR